MSEKMKAEVTWETPMSRPMSMTLRSRRSMRQRRMEKMRPKYSLRPTKYLRMRRGRSWPEAVGVCGTAWVAAGGLGGGAGWGGTWGSGLVGEGATVKRGRWGGRRITSGEAE